MNGGVPPISPLILLPALFGRRRGPLSIASPAQLLQSLLNSRYGGQIRLISLFIAYFTASSYALGSARASKGHVRICLSDLCPLLDDEQSCHRHCAIRLTDTRVACSQTRVVLVILTGSKFPARTCCITSLGMLEKHRVTELPCFAMFYSISIYLARDQLIGEDLVLNFFHFDASKETGVVIRN